MNPLKQEEVVKEEKTEIIMIRTSKSTREVVMIIIMITMIEIEIEETEMTLGIGDMKRRGTMNEIVREDMIEAMRMTEVGTVRETENVEEIGPTGKAAGGTLEVVARRLHAIGSFP